MQRRQFLQSLAALAPGAALLPAAAQDAWPARSIRFVCGSSPGALLDVASRLYAERMGNFLKQPLVVENMAGASSLLAARAVARTEPDGYTLLSAANTLATIPHLQHNAGYGMKDFTPVGEMARSPSILVVSSQSSFHSIADLVTAAKKKDAALSFASGGQGTTSHLPSELFCRQAGISLTHVPYKGVAAAVPDLVSNRVAFLMSTATSVSGLIDKGMLRVLAISSDKRSPRFPNVPTFKELGYPDATFEVWVGVFAPANLPKPVRARLGQAMEAARSDPAVAKRLEQMGDAVSALHTPEQFESFVRVEEDKYARLIRDAHIVAE
jgi:tripartite-type tricarboxylate transporter receptor subunit TctC